MSTGGLLADEPTDCSRLLAGCWGGGGERKGRTNFLMDYLVGHRH